MAPTRWRIVPEQSHVWIDGASTLHPIRAVAAGLSGSLILSVDESGPVPGTELAGHIEIAVDRLASGNSLVDRETRRRIDAARHPAITGTIDHGTVVDTDTLVVEGTIAFRGERVTVEGELDVRDATSERLVLVGVAIFDVRWWGLDPPRLGPLSVNPEIEVTIEVRLVPAGAEG
jgi:hypothetical protein